MILRQATIKYKGYDPEDLSKGSIKRICVSCDQCGRVRYIGFNQYRKLCKSCSKSGINHPMYKKNHSKKSRKNMSKSQIGHKVTDETKNKISKGNSGENNGMYGKGYKISGENNGMFDIHKFGQDSAAWKGGIAGIRTHVLHERDCTKLNQRFKGSEMHHIMSGVVIFIPKYLHNRKYGISHDLKNNKNMNIINKVTWNYLMGDFK